MNKLHECEACTESRSFFLCLYVTVLCFYATYCFSLSKPALPISTVIGVPFPLPHSLIYIFAVERCRLAWRFWLPSDMTEQITRVQTLKLFDELLCVSRCSCSFFFFGPHHISRLFSTTTAKKKVRLILLASPPLLLRWWFLLRRGFFFLKMMLCENGAWRGVFPCTKVYPHERAKKHTLTHAFTRWWHPHTQQQQHHAHTTTTKKSCLIDLISLKTVFYLFLEVHGI